MWTNEKAVFNKKPNFEKLTAHGFKKKEDLYVFSSEIMNDLFRLHIYVTTSGVTKLEVMDKETNDEYTLVKNTSAVGSFVGSVRNECENILNDIVGKCYEPDNVSALVDGQTYLAGYHMNKKHWYTIRLDGSVPIEEIYERIDISFDTLKKDRITKNGGEAKWIM